jgi:hypothetical protein
MWRFNNRVTVLMSLAVAMFDIAHAGIAAIGLTSADGAIVENIRYSEITVRKAARPIFMLVTSRLRSGDANRHIGASGHVAISDLTSTNSKPRRDVPVSPAIIVGKGRITHRQCYVAERVSCLGWRWDQTGQMDPARTDEAIFTKLSHTCLRQRCLLVIHAPYDFKMCSFPARALTRGHPSSRSM